MFTDEQVADMAAGLGAWRDWTPTVTQGVGVTVTVSNARYAVIGKVCFLYAKLTLTSAGTAGQAMVVGGIPAGIAPLATYMGVGSFMYYDAGSTYKIGAPVFISDTTLRLRCHLGGDLGVDPAITCANTDELTFTIMYELA